MAPSIEPATYFENKINDRQGDNPQNNNNVIIIQSSSESNIIIITICTLLSHVS